MSGITKLIIGLLIVILLSVVVVSFSNKQIPFSLFGGQEVHSPSDWVKEEQIKVFKDKVIIDIPDATWARFTDTNSMDPFIDETSNAIELKPQNPADINIGDVISYQTSSAVLIHRVIEKGEDHDGFYYIVKGDNNTVRDPFKVRFANVKGVVVAVIY